MCAPSSQKKGTKTAGLSATLPGVPVGRHGGRLRFVWHLCFSLLKLDTRQDPILSSPREVEQTLSSARRTTPSQELAYWLPLQRHPAFFPFTSSMQVKPVSWTLPKISGRWFHFRRLASS